MAKHLLQALDIISVDKNKNMYFCMPGQCYLYHRAGVDIDASAAALRVYSAVTDNGKILCSGYNAATASILGYIFNGAKELPLETPGGIYDCFSCSSFDVLSHWSDVYNDYEIIHKLSLSECEFDYIKFHSLSSGHIISREKFPYLYCDYTQKAERVFGKNSIVDMYKMPESPKENVGVKTTMIRTCIPVLMQSWPLFSKLAKSPVATIAADWCYALMSIAEQLDISNLYLGWDPQPAGSTCYDYKVSPDEYKSINTPGGTYRYMYIFNRINANDPLCNIDHLRPIANMILKKKTLPNM